MVVSAGTQIGQITWSLS